MQKDPRVNYGRQGQAYKHVEIVSEQTDLFMLPGDPALLE